MTSRMRNRLTIAAVAALILIAMACRYPLAIGSIELPVGFIRSGIYLCLFGAWGASISHRVVHKNTRQYLVAIAALMIFWFFMRTLRYLILSPVRHPDLNRWLWYSYYIPMLCIPVLSLFAAMTVGKTEESRMPLGVRLLWVPTLLLIAFILTNDFHQLVFSFPRGILPWTSYDYHHERGYLVAVTWMVACAVAALAIIAKKCRIPHTKRILWLPFVPFALALIYTLLYIFARPLIKPLAGDMTLVLCLLIIAIFESCIQSHLIMSNTHFGDLFQASTLSAQIVDNDLNVRYAGGRTLSLSASEMTSAQTAPLLLDDGNRLRSAPIRGGHVYWQEDISALRAVLKDLDSVQSELMEYGNLIEEESAQKRRQSELEEQQRLYDAVRGDLALHINRVAQLSQQLMAAENVGEAKRLLGSIAVVGAYLKRRSNLVFLAEQHQEIPARELLLCLEEMASNAQLAGIPCALTTDSDRALSPAAAFLCFDFFGAAVEVALESPSSLTLFLEQQPERWNLRIMTSSDADFAPLADRFPQATITRDDGIWYCTLSIEREIEREGGAHE